MPKKVTTKTEVRRSKSTSSRYSEGAPFIVSHMAASLAILAVIILVASAVGWWKYVYTSPRRVFSGMLTNSLSTPSVTREVTSSGNGQTSHQYIQLNFVGQPTSHSVVTINQSSGGIKSDITTETIGTPTRDYSRYIKITSNQKNATGKNLNFSSVDGLWGATAPAESGASSSAVYLQQSVLGFVPFANLNPDQREAFVRQLLSSKVYNVNYAKASSVKVGNRAAWQYTVQFNTGNYLKVFKNIANELGLGTLPTLSPDTYKTNPPLSISFTVDKASRELLKISYNNGQQHEDYTSYGISTAVALPAKVISIDDLQSRLEAIH